MDDNLTWLTVLLFPAIHTHYLPLITQIIPLIMVNGNDVVVGVYVHSFPVCCSTFSQNFFVLFFVSLVYSDDLHGPRGIETFCVFLVCPTWIPTAGCIGFPATVLYVDTDCCYSCRNMLHFVMWGLWHVCRCVIHMCQIAVLRMNVAAEPHVSQPS